MNIGQLFVTLGIKGQGLGTLKDVASKIAGLPADAAAAIAGMAGISLELSKMAQEAMHTAVAFQAFTNQTGLSWQQLQRWQIVAEQANVSTDAVATSISGLERNLAEIRLGRGNIAPFQMLGIDPRQDAFGVLEQLRKRIKGLNPATATNMITQMGLSPDMMNVLRLTDQQFTTFSNHVHGLTERQEQDFLKAKLSIVELGQSFRYAMFGILSDFTEAIEKAKQFKGVLIALGAIAAVVAIYFFPITSAMAALLLVLDDLAVYFTGGKSLTGLGVEGFKKFSKELGEFIAKSDSKSIMAIATAVDFLARAFLNLEEAIKNIRAIKGDWFPSVEQPSDWVRFQMMMGKGSSEKPAPRETTINMHIHGAGDLDAPGWENVAHMVKKSVEAAHLQLNN